MQNIAQWLQAHHMGWVIKLVAWAAVFATPVHDSLVAVAALVVADLVAGIAAAKKSGAKITSYGLRRTIVKILGYEMAVICSWIVERTFLPGIPLVKAAAGFIAVTELKSVLENLTKVTGLDVWANVRSLLQGPPKEK